MSFDTTENEPAKIFQNFAKKVKKHTKFAKLRTACARRPSAGPPSRAVVAFGGARKPLPRRGNRVRRVVALRGSTASLREPSSGSGVVVRPAMASSHLRWQRPLVHHPKMMSG